MNSSLPCTSKGNPTVNSQSPFLNRVLFGDCISILRSMPAASVDFILTDPPYLVNFKTRDGRAAYPNDDNTHWLKPAFAEMFRVLKPDSYCVCFYGWMKAEFFLQAWKQVGFYPVSHLVWIKNYCSRREHTQWYHDTAYLLTKGNPPKPKQPTPDVFDWHYGGSRSHPAQRPVHTITPLIAAFSKPGDVVLDPFAGSGTTGLAAKEMRRNYILIEKVWRYSKLARDRLFQASPK